ncbi:pilus assembly protein [Sphingomonas sp. MG17]|uniref:Pilus assembly protein n=1 Tax=Sphingomonas tagetis TaxID=2949092 RepID=A0A9X2HLB1_9SPHN|nr:TadE/TadG family type IV pilus assembly protein [Sphingomonas tagetis]MCP3731782.1 pilus assembly protein [Sphingomonas tagetis]
MTRRFSLRRITAGALARDEAGVTIVEFAMVAPVLCLVLLGAFDVSHTLYTRAALQGIVQKTARDSTLESGAITTQQTALDNKVKDQVRALANNATIDITRRYYRTFAEASAARAEVYSDTNSNGTCDNGEPYEDANRNSSWDKDGANSGQGGAKDATLYTVTMSYPRFFPIYNLVGGSNTTKVTASTVLRNQPYSDQGTYAAMQVRNCT